MFGVQKYEINQVKVRQKKSCQINDLYWVYSKGYVYIDCPTVSFLCH